MLSHIPHWAWNKGYLDIGTSQLTVRGGFNFPIMNFPFICCNIPTAPAYGVYISQLIRYSRACGSYRISLFETCSVLSRKLLNQGFLLVKMKSSLRKFYDRHHNLVDRYGISVWQINDNGYVPFVVCNHNPVLSSFITDHWVCNRKSNTTGFTCGTGTAYLSGASEYNLGYWRVSYCLIFSFPCGIVLCDLLVFVSSLVSSNFSWLVCMAFKIKKNKIKRFYLLISLPFWYLQTFLNISDKFCFSQYN
jgi:hypothetical protein